MEPRYRSPDGTHEARLVYQGEVHWGPEYYSLALDGEPMGGRTFGDACLWSPDGRYLAIQEWRTTDYIKGPGTQLVVLDIGARRQGVVDRARGGFVSPRRFEGDRLIHIREYHDTRTCSELQTDLASCPWGSL